MSYPSTSKIILCIDDDAGVLQYQKALLERCGYAVLTASSAREGLQIAAGSGVAAVIVDYQKRRRISITSAGHGMGWNVGGPTLLTSQSTRRMYFFRHACGETS